MIASVRGEVLDIALDHAGDRGRRSRLPRPRDPGDAGRAPRGAPRRTLLTTMIVREDSMTLYGFADTEARECSRCCRPFPASGPRLAMATLAVLEPDALRMALADEQRRGPDPGAGNR